MVFAVMLTMNSQGHENLEGKDILDDTDINNENFWKKIGQIFSKIQYSRKVYFSFNPIIFWII